MAKAKASRKKCSEKVKCLPHPVKATSHAQDGTVVARQLITMHQPKSEQIFLKPLFPGFFLCGYCGTFFGLDTNFCISAMTHS